MLGRNAQATCPHKRGEGSAPLSWERAGILRFAQNDEVNDFLPNRLPTPEDVRKKWLGHLAHFAHRRPARATVWLVGKDARATNRFFEQPHKTP